MNVNTYYTQKELLIAVGTVVTLHHKINNTFITYSQLVFPLLRFCAEVECRNAETYSDK